ncbi:AAA family ATPase [Sulfitobacter sp. D35]|uniref:AAA family ATPase n=1 Tax=Sulfitobacter sp. D35 TaxID=3083252 RepID=UPI00296EEC53|nr:AAA family ATPase [Sulfitobacter sp. D35]MDW4498815.1 AAA family ATPase [Sulfitobacter sp. D35]
MAAADYLSPALLEWCRAPSTGADYPQSERFDGAVMLVDISGSTALTLRLSREGTRGVEQINRVLTRFFSDLVALIEGFGGTVLGYEGDSVLAGWRAEEGEDPQEAIHACCACAMAVRAQFSPRKVEGQELDVRIAAGVGRIELNHFGQPGARRFLVPSGDAIDEAAWLAAHAGPGDVRISDDLATRLGDRADTVSQGDETYRLVRFQDMPGSLSEAPARFRDRPADAVLLEYLPPIVLARLNSALADWMAELRQVTVLFLEIALRKGAGRLDAANQAVLDAEAAVEKLGGDVLHVALRNGLVVINGAFGLPSEATSDDDWRAIAAAMEMQKMARRNDFDCSAGIATGKVFCGPFGAPHCRDYTVIGSAVNLAARLREVAAGRILLDDTTRQVSQRLIRFDGPWSLQLSGIRRSVKAYSPAEGTPAELDPVQSLIVGRDAELSALAACARRSRDRLEVVLVHGEAGIGKSTLVGSFLGALDAVGDGAATGHTDALDRQTPYLAWRRILRRCLGLSESDLRAGEALPALMQRLQTALGDTTYAPLLNDVIDVGLPETRVTASMASNVRAENLRRMLAEILLFHLGRDLKVIVIEDTHWLDENSRALLGDVLRAAPPAMVLLTSRTRAAVADALAEASDLRDMPLRRLEEADVVTLAQRQLGEAEIPDRLASFIVQTSDGVPLFVEELCHLVTSRPGKGALDPSGEDKPVELPHLLEATILGRVDALTPDDQRVLKTASVFGLRFRRDRLARLGPLRTAGIDVAAAIDRIVAVRLFKPGRGGGSAEMSFRHQIIRDLVYDGMLSDQKAETHAAVARGLEAETTAEDVEALPQLLSHWRAAGDSGKVLTYLERVATLRLRQFDNPAAIALLHEYFETRERAGTDDDAIRDARCHLMLGRAHSGHAQMSEAETAYRAGLARLGLPLPRSRAAVLGALGREMVRHLGGRRHSGPIPPPARRGERTFGKDEVRAELAAQAHEVLMQIYYFNGEKGRLLHSALCASNFASDLGVSTPSLAINTAGLGAICGVIPLRRSAQHLLGRAAAIAEVVDDPTASSRVCLFAGLYQVAIGDWQAAQANFESGFATAEALNDRRLWCEHAASYELICSPWSLTPAFRDTAYWASTIARLEEIARDRDDMQVLACAVLGRMRGQAILGPQDADDPTLESLRSLMGLDPSKLEVIHYVEGAGLLARAAFSANKMEDGAGWLDLARQHLPDLHPGMKSRTLPALVALFDACLHPRLIAASDGKPPRDILRPLMRKFSTFARIYPIGRPHLLRCQGDLAAVAGQSAKSQRHWRESLDAGARLKSRIAAACAAHRLSSSGARASPAQDGLKERLDAGSEEIGAILDGYLSRPQDLAPLRASQTGRGGFFASIR